MKDTLSVKPKISKMYVKWYKEHYWKFKEQPHFWEAVVKLAEDMDADVSDLLIDNESGRLYWNIPYDLLGYDPINYFSIGYDKKEKLTNDDVKSVKEFAIKFATEIRNSEKSKSSETSQYEIFCLKKELDLLRKRMDYAWDHLFYHVL